MKTVRYWRSFWRGEWRSDVDLIGEEPAQAQLTEDDRTLHVMLGVADRTGARRIEVYLTRAKVLQCARRVGLTEAELGAHLRGPEMMVEA